MEANAEKNVFRQNARHDLNIDLQISSKYSDILAREYVWISVTKQNYVYEEIQSRLNSRNVTLKSEFYAFVSPV